MGVPEMEEGGKDMVLEVVLEAEGANKSPVVRLKEWKIQQGECGSEDLEWDEVLLWQVVAQFSPYRSRNC